MRTIRVDFLNRYHTAPGRESNKLAYLAGLIDGEGYVKVEKWGVIRLVIGMTAKNVILWLKRNFGGATYLDQVTTGNKNYHIWRLNNSLDVLKLMILVYPYLILKKKKVLHCMKFLVKRMIKHPKFESLKGLKFK